MPCLRARSLIFCFVNVQVCLTNSQEDRALQILAHMPEWDVTPTRDVFHQLLMDAALRSDLSSSPSGQSQFDNLKKFLEMMQTYGFHPTPNTLAIMVRAYLVSSVSGLGVARFIEKTAAELGVEATNKVLGMAAVRCAELGNEEEVEGLVKLARSRGIQISQWRRAAQRLLKQKQQFGNRFTTTRPRRRRQ